MTWPASPRPARSSAAGWSQVAAAGRLPALQKVSSRYLTRQVRHRLDVYGIPEYTTDHRHYAH